MPGAAPELVAFTVRSDSLAQAMTEDGLAGAIITSTQGLRLLLRGHGVLRHRHRASPAVTLLAPRALRRPPLPRAGTSSAPMTVLWRCDFGPLRTLRFPATFRARYPDALPPPFYCPGTHVPLPRQSGFSGGGKRTTGKVKWFNDAKGLLSSPRSGDKDFRAYSAIQGNGSSSRGRRRRGVVRHRAWLQGPAAEERFQGLSLVDRLFAANAGCLSRHPRCVQPALFHHPIILVSRGELRTGTLLRGAQTCRGSDRARRRASRGDRVSSAGRSTDREPHVGGCHPLRGGAGPRQRHSLSNRIKST